MSDARLTILVDEPGRRLKLAALEAPGPRWRVKGTAVALELRPSEITIETEGLSRVFELDRDVTVSLSAEPAAWGPWPITLAFGATDEVFRFSVEGVADEAAFEDLVRRIAHAVGRTWVERGGPLAVRLGADSGSFGAYRGHAATLEPAREPADYRRPGFRAPSVEVRPPANPAVLSRRIGVKKWDAAVEKVVRVEQNGTIATWSADTIDAVVLCVDGPATREHARVLLDGDEERLLVEGIAVSVARAFAVGVARMLDAPYQERRAATREPRHAGFETRTLERVLIGLTAVMLLLLPGVAAGLRLAGAGLGFVVAWAIPVALTLAERRRQRGPVDPWVDRPPPR